jgi:hypothetical protein
MKKRIYEELTDALFVSAMVSGSDQAEADTQNIISILGKNSKTYLPEDFERLSLDTNPMGYWINLLEIKPSLIKNWLKFHKTDDISYNSLLKRNPKIKLYI